MNEKTAHLYCDPELVILLVNLPTYLQMIGHLITHIHELGHHNSFNHMAEAFNFCISFLFGWS